MHNGFLKFQEKQEKEREENKILLHVREETRMLVFVEIKREFSLVGYKHLISQGYLKGANCCYSVTTSLGALKMIPTACTA